MVGNFGRAALGLMVAVSTMFGAFAFATAGAPAAAAQSAGDAHVRVLHASPDAPAVDVYVNGTKAFSNLAFKDVSAWAALPAGSYDVKVTPAGGTATVIQAKLSLEADKYYTVAATGKLANITPKVFMDDLNDPTGKARLRVIHLSPDAPAVDVAVKGGAVLVPSLTYPNASDYLSVDPMTVDVEVRPAGTTTVALAVPGVTLEANKVYTIYAVGLLSGSPALSVVPVADTALAAMSGPAPVGMPATGAGDGIFTLATIALLLMALATSVGGIAIRVRNR